MLFRSVAEAVCDAHFGNFEAAKEGAHAALALKTGRDVEFAAAFALALSSDITGSQTLAAELANEFPEDTTVQFQYLPILRALFAMSQKAPLDATEHLQMSVPLDLALPGTAFFGKFGSLYSVYVRALAYLDANRPAEAVTELQKILDNRGIVLADPIGALTHLHLSRAYTQLGEPTLAHSENQTFHSIWKTADEDLPLVKNTPKSPTH